MFLESHYGTTGAASFAGVAKSGLTVLVVTRFDFHGCSIIEIREKRIAILFVTPPFERREDRGPQQLDFVAGVEGWAPTLWFFEGKQIKGSAPGVTGVIGRAR